MPDERTRSLPQPSAAGWKPKPNQTILCVKEAAAYLRLSKSALDRWRTQKPEPTGPAFVVLGTKKVGYLVEDLDAWIAAQRVTPTR